MKVNKQIRKGRLSFLSVIMALSTLLMLGAGCWLWAPTQRAEKAFTKLFEKDYPDWKVSKIVLTPCKAKNEYRGMFECVARWRTQSCWLRQEERVGQKTYLYPCSYWHERGEVMSGSIYVTYAHGDCFYNLNP